MLSKLIGGTLGYPSILAILILCKFLDEINFTKFDKLFFKDIIKYYIAPLIALLVIDIVYPKLADAISELNDSFMVNYVYFAMCAIYDVLIANIMMTMLVLLFGELINSKIHVNVSPKNIFIFSSIILIILLCIKFAVGFISSIEANNKIEILNNAIQSNNLNTFYELDLEPNIKLEDMDDIMDKEQRYMVSFNDILVKSMSSWSELFYKTETNALKNLVNDKTFTKVEALQRYIKSAKNYVDRLNIYKDNLSMQNASNAIIYLLDIICISIVYKKSTM